MTPYCSTRCPFTPAQTLQLDELSDTALSIADRIERLEGAVLHLQANISYLVAS